MKSVTPYCENLETLIALITHLGATDRASRTPTCIAEDLGISKEKVQHVLQEFPGFFRRSKNSSKEEKSRGECFYTLHLQYSRRLQDKEEEGKSQPLKTDEIDMLISILSHMVAQEQENVRAEAMIAQGYEKLESSNRSTMIAATIAAIASVFAAIFSGVPNS